MKPYLGLVLMIGGVLLIYGGFRQAFRCYSHSQTTDLVTSSRMERKAAVYSILASLGVIAFSLGIVLSQQK